MIRVLLADDEPYFREFMRKVVDWEGMGFQIVGMARNGEEAYQIVQEKPVDVLFLDINMPHTDGLELARRLREKNSNSTVVFVTGYPKFEYAQRALQLGVEEYMLKPFSKEEMQSVLFKIRKKFLLHSQKARKQRQNDFIVRDHFLYQLLTSRANPNQDLPVRLKDFGIQFSNGPCRVALVSMDHFHEEGYSTTELAALQYGIKNILGEITEIQGFHYLIETPDHMTASLLVFQDRQAAECFCGTPYHRLIRLVQQILDLSVSVGVGIEVPDYQSLPQSYRSALTAVKSLSLTQKGQVIYADQMKSRAADFGLYQVQQDEELLSALRNGDLNQISSILKQIETYVQTQHFSNDLIYSIAISIISVCFLYLTEIGETKKDVLGESHYYSDVTSCKDCHQLFTYLYGIFSEIEAYLKKQQENRAQKIVSQVKQYIYENYSDPSLTVEGIAKHFFITDSYLRRVFSKQLGETVSGCIIEVRMQQAEKLLKKNLSTAEVAEQAGYRDTGYFSKCFKKRFGKPPSSFRKG